MAITNVSTLPGLNVQVADGRLRVAPPQPGVKLTLLGTTSSLALDDLQPVQLDSIPRALTALRHTDGSPSELSLAVAEAAAAGASNIEVIKIATTGLSGVYDPKDRFDDLEAAYDILKLHDVDVVVPVGAHLDETGLTGNSPAGIARSSGFGRQLGDFCFQSTVNGNTAVGVLGVTPIMKLARREAWAGAPTTDAEEFFDEPSFQYLKEWKNHLYAEAGTLDDHSAETELAGYLAGSEEDSPGVISANYTFWARDEDGNIATDQNGRNVDGGGYITVVAIAARAVNDETQNLANGLNVPSNSSYNALSSGAVGYGALITRLKPHQGTTFKTIPGYSPARKMSRTIAQQLLRARMVTMFDSDGSFVVSSGITGAYDGSRYTRSDFTSLTTRRITHAAIDLVRFAGSRFIGEPINAPNLAALEFELDRALDGMKPDAIQSHFLNVSATADEQVLGEIRVEMELAIGFELKKINTYVQLSKPEALA